ncbi:MAG TPA: type II secretion system F family protein [Phycisphaerae bacterium]|nr:type II secretion system F family protein [Phycisphaerae bacterium]
MPFECRAIDGQGREVTSVIDAPSAEDASEQLHAQRLFVTHVRKVAESRPIVASSKAHLLRRRKPGSRRDRMLFTQQMAMMLRSGSRVVPALTAIGSQVEKPRWREVIEDVSRKVEGGASLSEAMADHPSSFDRTFRAIIAAGESTGAAADAFTRLAQMTRRQQEISLRVIGALVYPGLLLLLSVGVLCLMVFYVLPKFDRLYQLLGIELPLMTRMMLSGSQAAVDNGLILGVALAAIVAAPILLWRQPAFKRWRDRALLRLPLVSHVVKQLVLAKIFRVLGVLVHSNVPLLEGLRLSRALTANCLFLAVLEEVADAVEDGQSVGESLARHPLIPATMSSAVATGERSGRLSDSLLFLADYLDEENSQMLAALTRLIEPLILIFMGVIVGAMAISLFLPLFDVTAAASAH